MFTDLSDAIQKDKQTAQKTQTPAKPNTQTTAKKGNWKAAHAQDSWNRAARGNFTVEEINLIAIYLGETRAATISQIAAALPYMDREMQSIAESASRKLSALEEQDYSKDAFIPADDYDEV